eukprot:SAG25_NODE_493_length_7405_cov_1.946756_4_plen_45_part_00
MQGGRPSGSNGRGVHAVRAPRDDTYMRAEGGRLREFLIRAPTST